MTKPKYIKLNKTWIESSDIKSYRLLGRPINSNVDYYRVDIGNGVQWDLPLDEKTKKDLDKILDNSKKK